MTSHIFGKINYHDWKQCYQIVSGDIAIVVIPAIGARLFSIKYKGIEFCRQNPDAYGRIATPQEPWLNWGGDFDWVGPQRLWNKEGWPPPFELDSAPWDVLSFEHNRIEVQSKPSILGIQIYKEIVVSEEGLTINRQLRNAGESPVSYGLWNVTQVGNTGKIVIPLDSLSGSAVKVFASPEGNTLESLESRQVLSYGQAAAPAVVIKENIGHFKVGLLSNQGLIDYIYQGYVMRKEVKQGPGLPYPHDCNIEIYRDERAGYTELEQLWEMVDLSPGKSFTALQSYYFMDKKQYDQQ